MKEKIVLAGGSGFIGEILAKWFCERSFEVVVLSRGSFNSQYARGVNWDGRTKGGWASEIEGALAVINLSGRSVDCRATKRNRQILFNSRIYSTKIIGEIIAQCANPPKVWINSSTATIYEHTYGEPHSEEGRIAPCPDVNDEFSLELALAWEKEVQNVICPKTRKIIMRISMVFDGAGSVYKVLRNLVKFGLGGKMGHGKQYVSWIHSKDFCRAVEHLIRSENSSGAYNFSAPNPVSNSLMMSSIRQVLNMPIGLPATKWMLEIGAFFLRTETELLLKSRRNVPTKLLSEGFIFEYEDFLEAVSSFEK